MSLTTAETRFGGLKLDGLHGRARVTPAAFALQPIDFEVFGGRYSGSLTLTLAETPAFQLKASLSGVDMSSVMAFAGSPGAITGHLSGTLDVAGDGTTAREVIGSTHGTAHVSIANGAVKGLGLVHGVVLALSGRQDSRAQLGATSMDEPFTTLAATLNIGSGAATTRDLRFESKDLLLAATGSMRLDGSAVHLSGPLQLSEALSQQAGRDLVRYTQEQGRVTLPATITGSLDHLQVQLDLAAVTKRAIRNRANEETQKAIQKGLGGLLRGSK